MGASAPKRTRLGRHTSSTMKPKPKALKAGMAPITREAITPAKIRTTASAAASAAQRNRASPALARRADAARSEMAAGRAGLWLKLISVKTTPRARAGRKFTPAPRHEHHSLAKLL